MCLWDDTNDAQFAVPGPKPGVMKTIPIANLYSANSVKSVLSVWVLV